MAWNPTAVDNRRFDAEAPDKAWVTDFTYIRTHEGFAYLAVVLDLFSRRVVGWSMQPPAADQCRPASSARRHLAAQTEGPRAGAFG